MPTFPTMSNRCSYQPKKESLAVQTVVSSASKAAAVASNGLGSLEVVASLTFEASTQSLLSISSSLLQLLFGSPLSLKKGLTHFTRSCSVAVSSFFR